MFINVFISINSGGWCINVMTDKTVNIYHNDMRDTVHKSTHTKVSMISH